MAQDSRQKPARTAAKARQRPRPRHIADEPLPEPAQPDAGVQPPVTDTGLIVEEQVEKEWDPKKDGGLPTFLRSGGR
ncbi:MAG TPA: hypothetical protein VHU15_09130 [Stellaceae bacterium]|nr:hypothetical protein [Stellaceae bacterium]